MEKNVTQIVTTCLSCQKHHLLSLHLIELLKIVVTLCQFDQWRMDIIEPFHQRFSNEISPNGC